MFKSALLTLLFTFPIVFSVSLSFESSSDVSNIDKKRQLFNPHQLTSEKRMHVDPVEEFFNKVVLVKDDKFLPPGYPFGPPSGSLVEIGSRKNNDKKYINEETLIEDELGENTSESEVEETLINEESGHTILDSLFNDNHFREKSNEVISESIQTQKINGQTFPETLIFDEETLSKVDQINLHKDKSFDEDTLIETFLDKEVFSERASDGLDTLEELLIEEGASNNIDDLNTDLEIKEKIFDWKITKDNFQANEQFKSNVALKQFISPRSSLSPTSNNPPKSSTSPNNPPKIPQTFNSHPRTPSISNSPLKSSPISLFSVRKRKHKTQKEKKKPALKKAMTKLKFDMSKIDFESILESSQSREKAISKPMLDKIPELDTRRFKFSDVDIPNIESIDVATATIGSTDVAKSVDVSIPITKSSDVTKSADVSIPTTKSSAIAASKASIKDVPIQSSSKTPNIETITETPTASSRSTSTKSTTKEATSRSTTEEVTTKSTRRVTKTTTRTTTEAIYIPLATEEISLTEETTISTTEKTPRSPTSKVTSRSTITDTSMTSSTIEAISRSTTEATTKSTTQMTSLSTPITAITRTFSGPNKDSLRSTTLKTTTIGEILNPTLTETSSSSTTKITSKSVTEAPSRSLTSASCGEYCGIDGTFHIKSGIDWSRELRNTTALNLFKTVSREIVVDLIRIFRNSSIGSSFRSVHVNSLYPKSKQSSDIVVDIYVRLRGNNSDDTVDKVKTVFGEGLVNSSLGRFGIDESRAKFSFSKDRAPVRRKVNQMEILDIILPDWAWMGIGVLTVSVSFIGILGMVFACNRRRKARDVNVMSPHVLAHIRKKMSLDGIYDDSFTEDIIQDIRSSVSGCNHTNHTHRTSVRDETRSSVSGCNNIRRTVRDKTDYNLHRTSLMDETDYRSRSRSEGSRTHQQNRGKRGVSRGDSYRPRAATDSYGPRESYRPNGYKRGTSREMQINHKNMLLNGSNQHNVSKRSTTNIYKRNNKRPNVGLYDSRSPSVSSQDIRGTSVSSYNSRGTSVSSYDTDDSRRPSVSSCDSRQQLVNVDHEEILSSNIFINGGNLRNGNQRGRSDRSSCLVQRQVISSDEETIYDNILTNQSRTSEKMVGKAKRFVYTKDSWSGGVYAVPRTKRRTPLPGFETPKYEDDLPTSLDYQNTSATESSGSSLESPSNMVRMLSYRKI